MFGESSKLRTKHLLNLNHPPSVLQDVQFGIFDLMHLGGKILASRGRHGWRLGQEHVARKAETTHCDEICDKL